MERPGISTLVGGLRIHSPQARQLMLDLVTIQQSMCSNPTCDTIANGVSEGSSEAHGFPSNMVSGYRPPKGSGQWLEAKPVWPSTKGLSSAIRGAFTGVPVSASSPH